MLLCFYVVNVNFFACPFQQTSPSFVLPKMTRQIIILSILLFFSNKLLAQPVVTGHVVDNTTGKPIEFATVDLVTLPDSTTVFTTVTDKKGNFTIDTARGGPYIIICSFIGYDFYTTKPFQVVPGNTHKVETI